VSASTAREHEGKGRISAEGAVALIGAVRPTLAAAPAFLATRSVRRSVATQGQVRIEILVEHLERRVETPLELARDRSDRSPVRP